MPLQHSNIYNSFKVANKQENSDPEKIQFWENSDATRRVMILSHKYLINLVKRWKSEKDVDEKNKILNQICRTVNNIANRTKQHKQYFEARLLYMQAEKVLMNAGINPINIRGALEDKGENENNSG